MNNVYVRDKNSIKLISLTRLAFIFPLIVYGFYKNGISLYNNHYIDIYHLFKPIVMILAGLCIGAFVNIFYEKIIHKSKDSIMNILFSSFHIEYGILIACVMSINTNVFIFTGITFIMLLISKFIKNRVNMIAFTSMLIIIVSNYIKPYDFKNIYEASKVFSLNFMDYVIGRNPGGIASTHILLIIIAIIGLYLTSNNKTAISVTSLTTYGILAVSYMFFSKHYSLDVLFLYNVVFAFSFIATDSVTSCSTNNGMVTYGILLGILTFAFYLLNPYIAPFAAITIISLFNNLIDRKTNMLKKDE